VTVLAGFAAYGSVRGNRRPLSELFNEDPPVILFVNGDFLVFHELRIPVKWSGIPIERDHAVRSKAATYSDEGGRGGVAGMRDGVSFLGCVKIGALRKIFRILYPVSARR
jgi:hypothetical protein